MTGVDAGLYEALLEQLRPELRDKHNNGLNILSVFAEEMETRRVEREAERAAWAAEIGERRAANAEAAQTETDARAELDAALKREAKFSHDLALAQAATEEAQRQAATHRATIDNYQRHCADIQLAAIEMMIQFGKLAQLERARSDHRHVTTSLRDHLPF
jgi:hypothetical protein